MFTVLVSETIDIIFGTSDGGSLVNSFLRGEGGIGSSILILEREPLVPLVCLWVEFRKKIKSYNIRKAP